jgi:hypothetical protein
MSEEATTVTEQQNQQQDFNPFQSSAWSEQPQPTENSGEGAATNAAATENGNAGQAPLSQTPEAAAPIPAAPVIPTEWLKNEFGIEDPQIIKQEREELKKLKETPIVPAQQEIKFADEQSKLIHELLRDGKTKEVREFLETQEKLDAFISKQVTSDNAADIIKLGIQLKNKNLTPDEVEFQYRQDYVEPKKPVQKTTETDEDFEERMSEWTEKVQTIATKRVVAAKMLQPELEKAKATITLPELSKPAPQVQEQSQESLEQLEKVKEKIWNALDSNYAKVDGFSTTVKDESVEFAVAFKIPDEAKVAIKDDLKKGFSPDEFFNDRWFDKDGTPKVEAMVKDRYVLDNLDKILSGVANNAASDRLKEYIKSTKNLNVATTPQQVFQQNENGGQQNANPFSENAWSETPPALVNN